ncbi:amidohydrolase family protein [Betaproteobacteria bacterium LSUCC0115]|nr:amidohydrolase family protein [Burkholderiales bacterium LSUCC0115]
MLNAKIWLKKSGLLLGCFLLLEVACAAEPTDVTRELARTVPLADFHMHVYGVKGSTPSNILRFMKENNVQWGGGVGHYQAEMQDELGPRYIAAIGSRAWAQVFRTRAASGLQILDQSAFDDLFAQAEQLFKEGKLKGFGEIHVKNKQKFDPSFERSIPLDSPVINKMYELANRYGGFVQIHSMGGIFGGYDEVSVMAERYPKALTILSHCLPATPPHLIGKLLDKHPNVACELSAQGLVHMPPPVGGRVFNRDGLRAEWANVIERHPTRFFVGTDPCCGLEDKYGEMIAEIRQNLLPYLTPNTLRRVAYQNAVERFGLPGQ